MILRTYLERGKEVRLVRVVAPHFVAGLVSDGVVREAAPILKYAVGWSDEKARAYFAGKGWRASVVSFGRSGG